MLGVTLGPPCRISFCPASLLQCTAIWDVSTLHPYRKASTPTPKPTTQRYHRSRVSIKKGLLQKGHDHMLWSRITTHYLQSCTVWVDLAIAFCRHNCLNKSQNATSFWTFSFVQQVFFGCKGAHSLVKTCLCLRISYKSTWNSGKIHPHKFHVLTKI